MDSITELISRLDRAESELVSSLDCDDWNSYCDPLGGGDSIRPRIRNGDSCEIREGWKHCLGLRQRPPSGT